MGLPLTVAINLIECSTEINKEKVLCLGKQDLKFSLTQLISSARTLRHKVDLSAFIGLDDDQVLDQERFFKALGFSHVHTLDVNRYEGAEIIFDLNEDKTPEEFVDSYDLIFDGGTLEHVFNIGNALKHLSKIVRHDGIIFHSNPCNGYVDHGFFQVSPNLYFDFYLSNEFNIVYAGIIEQSIGRKIYQVKQDIYRTLDSRFGPRRAPRSVLNFCVRRLEKSTHHIVPQQGFYQARWSDGSQFSYVVEKEVEMSKLRIAQKAFLIWINLPYSIIDRFRRLRKSK